MKTLYFVTPTLLSYIDLMSMGGSEKADDDTKLGTYCSGLKFSMALALRNNIDMSVEVFDTEYESEGQDRARKTLYTISTYTETCEQTDKEKELIQLTKSVSKQSFFSVHCDDYGGGDFPEEIIPTGFSVKMGIGWDLWMVLREIFSNMIDEGGNYYEDTCPEIKFGTVFELSFEDSSEFAEIWNNRHLYINEKPPLYIISDTVEALENEEGFLRIYKQNILVYKDEKIPSKFAYNIKLGTIDERRILSDVYGVEGKICDAIMQTKNEEFIREIITFDFKNKDKEFLSSRGSYYSPSELMHNIAFEIYEKHGEVKSYEWVIDGIKKLKNCKIGGKKITNVGDSVWAYSSTVTIETTPEPLSEPAIEVEGEILVSPFSAEIKKYYNFELDVEVTKAKLKGSKCIADKFNNCLIVDNEFNVETDFAELIVQYLDLTDKDNVIKSMSKYICKLLKK